MRAVSPSERRMAIYRALCDRRQDTVENLACEFEVSTKTIYRDIERLTCSYPIETVRGRYGGGVKIADWYHPTRTTLCPKQMMLLKKIAPSLAGEDLAILNSIISQFAPITG